jgi:hydroxypyruvate isomerase
MTRRTFLPAAVGSATALSPGMFAQAVKRKGRIKQCVTGGVFARSGLSFEDQCKAAANAGAVGFDLKGPQDFATIRKYGLLPTMLPGGSSIPDGTNRKEFHDSIEKKTREAIDAAASVKAPNVILLAGNRRGMGDEEGIANSVILMNKLKAQAEDKGVTLCLELLNSKVNHKDYHCDHTWWGVEVCKRTGSPRVKLLYDIYHMQIMEGDIIRTIKDNIQYLGHFHTGGNPGRHEIDSTQELNYGAIAQALVDIGYQGYVAHEYSPAPGRDWAKSLEQAMSVMDV